MDNRRRRPSEPTDRLVLARMGLVAPPVVIRASRFRSMGLTTAPTVLVAALFSASGLSRLPA